MVNRPSSQGSAVDCIDLDLAVAMLIDWQACDGPVRAIKKQFTFSGFDEAWAWMSKVANEARRLDHHPEWSNVFNVVTVLLTTHDANGVTMRDVELANFMDGEALR